MTSAGARPSEYRLNAQDIIAEVSPAFLAFARQNQAPALTRSALVGAPIWTFVAGLSTRAIYAAAFERVRATQRAISFPFRCDSPTCRRFMELTIAPASSNGLDLSAVLLRTEHRRAVPLLDPNVARSGSVLEACSFCKSIRVDEAIWLQVEDAIAHLGLFDSPQLPTLSHSVCPACLPEFHQRLGL